MTRFLTAFVLCLLIPLSAGAWSGFGHRLVGELAERQLSETSRDEVRRLLQDESEPTLAAIAAWADVVRNEPHYAWTEPLHYVRIHDRACRYVAERDCASGACVVGAIERYARELGDTGLDRSRRAEALKFLTHFVGDVHQPLHAGRRPDKGGNDFQISLKGEGTNLHSVWDYHLLASAGRNFDAWIVRLDATRLPARAESPSAWAEASCTLTDAEGFYPRRAGKLPAGYLEREQPLAERRLREAAAELAHLIEGALGPK